MKRPLPAIALSLTMALAMTNAHAQAETPAPTPVLGQTNAAPLGLEIGVANLQTVKSQLGQVATFRDLGTHRHSGGKVLKAAGSNMGIDGLREVTLMFDRAETLVGMLWSLEKRAKDAYTALAAKYSVKESKLDSNGDYGFAKLTKGDTVIELSASPGSPYTEIRYLTKHLHLKDAESLAKEPVEKRHNAR